MVLVLLIYLFPLHLYDLSLGSVYDGAEEGRALSSLRSRTSLPFAMQGYLVYGLEAQSTSTGSM